MEHQRSRGADKSGSACVDPNVPGRTALGVEDDFLLTIAGNWLAEEAGEGLQVAGQCGAPFFHRALRDFGDLPPAGGHGLGGLRP